LRKLTNDVELVDVEAETIGDAINELQTKYPGIQERLMDENGEVRRFVNIYLNEEDIRFLQNKETPIKDGDEVSIIPAIAGG
jgi:molybdopterin synthase sulfur carrier subunit